MPEWLLEFEGEPKPLGEITAPEITGRIDPVRAYIARALSTAGDDFDQLRVVFSFTEDGTLKFVFRGEPYIVNRAIDLVGHTAEISPSRN